MRLWVDYSLLGTDFMHGVSSIGWFSTAACCKRETSVSLKLFIHVFTVFLYGGSLAPHYIDFSNWIGDCQLRIQIRSRYIDYKKNDDNRLRAHIIWERQITVWWRPISALYLNSPPPHTSPILQVFRRRVGMSTPPPHTISPVDWLSLTRKKICGIWIRSLPMSINGLKDFFCGNRIGDFKSVPIEV